MKIDAPVEKSQWLVESVPFSGSVTEAGGTPVLEYQVGSGTWNSVIVNTTTKAGTFSWSTTVSLVPGLNTVSFRATDPANNVSKPTLRSLTYVQHSTFAIVPPTSGGTYKGSSTVFNNGVSYTFTATPATGKLFREWRDQNGNTYSRQSTVTVVAQDGLTLQPIFVDDFFPAAIGNYPGIYGDGAVGDGGAGAISQFNRFNGVASFTLSKGGAFTGNWGVAGKKVALKGQFDAYGDATISAAPSVGDPLNLALHLDTTGSTTKITGTATYSGSSFGFEAKRSPFDGKATIFPLQSRIYNVVLDHSAAPANVGYGYLSVVFGKDGTAKITGQLPDGVALSGASQVVEKDADTWALPISIQLTPLTNLLHGTLELPKSPTGGQADIEGTLTWLRTPELPGTKTPFRPAGLLYALDATGAQWIAPKGINILTGGTTASAFTIAIDSGTQVLTIPATRTGTWNSANAPVLSGTSKAVTFKFAASTGVFDGTVLKTGSTTSVPFKGIVLATPLEISGTSTLLHGMGYILSGTGSGTVEIISQP